jgi:capsular polysaccharide biosynthesis protein
MMNFIFSSPSLDDLIRLLRAGRFWALSALIGALIGAAVYIITPPPYRARATVNVDFNLEEAFPTDNDRQYFYYLERETRKMIEIAWSDEVLSELLIFSAEELRFSVSQLRDEKLNLAQPMEAGWHFYADDKNPEVAETLASLWANEFVEKVQAEIEAGNINEFVRLEVTQSDDLPMQRSIPLSSFLLAGSSVFLLLSVFFVLFTKPKNRNLKNADET